MPNEQVDSIKFRPLPVEIKLTDEQKERIKKDPRAIFKVYKENQKINLEPPVNTIKLTQEEAQMIKNDPKKAFEILKSKQTIDLKPL